MVQQFYTLLTNVGKAKLANASIYGRKINLTTLVVGDSNGNYYNPTEDQEELVHEVWRGNIHLIDIDEQNPNWIKIETVIPSDVGGFTIREVGGLDDEGNLILIAKYPETYKPILNDGATKELKINTILEVSNVENVTLKIKNNLITATMEDIEKLNKKIENIKVPVTSVNSKTGEIELKAENINCNDGESVESHLEESATHESNTIKHITEKERILWNNKADKRQIEGIYREVANLKLYQEAQNRIENGIIFADNFISEPMGIQFNEKLSTVSRKEFNTQSTVESLDLGIFTGAIIHDQWGHINISSSQMEVYYYYRWDLRYPHPIDMTNISKIEVEYKQVFNTNLAGIYVNTEPNVSWNESIKGRPLKEDRTTSTSYVTTLDVNDLVGNHYIGISSYYDSDKSYSYRQNAIISKVTIYRNLATSSITYDLPECSGVCAFIKRTGGVQVKAYVNDVEAEGKKYDDDETLVYHYLDKPTQINIRFEATGCVGSSIPHIIGGISK